MNIIPTIIITLFLLVNNKKEFKKSINNGALILSESVISVDSLKNSTSNATPKQNCDETKKYLKDINDQILIKYIEYGFYKNKSYFDTIDVGSLDPFLEMQYRTVCNAAIFVDNLQKDTLDRCRVALNFYNLYDSLHLAEVVVSNKYNKIVAQEKIKNLQLFDKFSFDNNWKLEKRRKKTIEIYLNYKKVYADLKTDFILIKKLKGLIKVSAADKNNYTNAVGELRNKYSNYPWLLEVLNEYEKNPDTFDENKY